ncbi:MAG TPA: cobalamin-dependent protein, partial [Chloroflexota bacterium]
MPTAYKRVVLVNPPWSFEGSRYWACTEPHVPLELLYPQALLRASGIEADVLDAHLEQLSPEAAARRVEAIEPDLIVVTTAPSYLFWRCPPPEMAVPARIVPLLTPIAPVLAIGPHGSATPRFMLEKLGCAGVVRGEPEMELVRIATGAEATSTVWAEDAEIEPRAAPAVVDVKTLPALDFAGYPLELRTHRHHVFSGEGRGA